MHIESIIAFFLLWDIRNILKATSPAPEWDKNIKLAMYAVAALSVIDLLIRSEQVTMWIWPLVIFLIISIIYFNKALFAARTIMWAVLPFAVLSLLSKISQLFPDDKYKVAGDYLDVANVLSVIWMVAMLINSRKQQKALEKERRRTQEEEEQNIILAKRKEELECIVAERTAELRQQKDELEKAIVALKSTQAQLIQSEKMASLGELTAGIAHEIQNPLNFVNNFSEVNTELIDEMQFELSAGLKEKAIAILYDIKANERKINHHGKRADAIVKGMLQHSRTSTGKKELTDINALGDEYLRLSYHGLRAKDKSFNADFKTDFDQNIEKIEIVPEEIGRAFLNLLNNAFYSVNEKKKQSDGAFKPVVSVSTRKVDDKIAISVKDNGTGIPRHVVDKIYHPFFTTKPAGHGTGLGLSLSFEIIKSHGGELKVETKEGEGAEFIIQLPAKC